MLIKYLSRKISRNHFHLQEQRFNKICCNEMQVKVAAVDLLRSCNTIAQARVIHAYILKNVPNPSIFQHNNIINVYLEFGSITDARELFEKMLAKNVFTWSIVIGGYVKHEADKEAIFLFDKMKSEGTEPNAVTHVIILSSCTTAAALEQGKRIHASALLAGYHGHVFVNNALMDMYAKSGYSKDGLQIFESMPTRDIVSWNSMVAGYIQSKEVEGALTLFSKMQVEGVTPNKISYVSILSICSDALILGHGKKFHADVLKSELSTDRFIGSTLIDMYAKCCSMKMAEQQFDRLPTRDAVCWNAMIFHNNDNRGAFNLFWQMQVENVLPNRSTLMSILGASAELSKLGDGKYFHAKILRGGLSLDELVGNSLVDMYIKCGCLNGACFILDRTLIPSTVTWTAVIAVHAECGDHEEALRLFRLMELAGAKPDKVTLLAILCTCADVLVIEEGKRIHASVLRSGCTSEIYIGATLVDMYAKCGCIYDAQEVFYRMPAWDVVTWNALIAGSTFHGKQENALMLFLWMLQEDIKPNEGTFLSTLHACSVVGCLEVATHIHSEILRDQDEVNVLIATALVDVYAKCGNLEQSFKVFKMMRDRDLISWNTMVSGYSQNGHAKEVLDLLGQMEDLDVKPNNVTFISVLSSCIHACLLEEGCQVFNSMTCKHKIEPSMNHYACMVDLLGRAGQFFEAEKLIKSMPYEPSVGVWISLLNACRIHNFVDLGEDITKHVLRLEPSNTVGLVLLSNLYAGAGMWDTALETRGQTEGSEAEGENVHTQIELSNILDAFVISGACALDQDKACRGQGIIC